MRIKRIASIVAALTAAAAVAVYATLSSLEFENLRGLAEDSARTATGRALKIAGPIDLQISLSPAIALEDVTFANAPWGSRPAMATVKRLELQVALLPLLFGDIEIRRLVLVEPDVLLETDRAGRGNWVFDGAAAVGGEAGGGSAPPVFSEILVRDGRATVRDGKTGRAIRLGLKDMRAHAAGRTSPVAFALTGTYNDADFKIDGVAGSAAALASGAAFPLKLAAEIGGARLEIEGRIEAPLSGQGADLKVAARGASLADLGAALGVPLPPLGPYTLAAQVVQEARAIKLTGIAVRIGDSDLAGNARLALGGARPAMAGQFTAALIDVRDFLPPSSPAPASGAGESATPATPAFVFPDIALPLEALDAVDADLTLNAGQLRIREELALADVNLRLAIKDRRLTVQPVAARVSGGRVAGALSLDARQSPPAFALQLEAREVDYGRLLADLGVTEGVAGTLQASVDVRGRGASPRAIAASLGGRVDVVGGEGRIANDLLRTAGTGALDMFSRWRAEDEDLRLNCVLARLPVQDGVATSEAILLDTAAVTVGGTGTIDLRDETLGLRVTPQAKQASLLSLAVPFQITGTLGAPAVGPDPLGTAVGAAKVAGILLNPLVAGATLLLDAETADRNPCVAALQPGTGGGDGAAPQGGVIDRTTRGVTDALEGVGEGLDKGLKSLFGN